MLRMCCASGSNARAETRGSAASGTRGCSGSVSARLSSRRRPSPKANATKGRTLAAGQRQHSQPLSKQRMARVRDRDVRHYAFEIRDSPECSAMPR